MQAFSKYNKGVKYLLTVDRSTPSIVQFRSNNHVYILIDLEEVWATMTMTINESVGSEQAIILKSMLCDVIAPNVSRHHGPYTIDV